MPGDAGKKRTIRDRRKNHAVLYHKDIGGASSATLPSMSQMSNCRIRACAFEKRAGIVRIKAAGFGVDGHFPVGRRKGDRVMDMPFGLGNGAT